MFGFGKKGKEKRDESFFGEVLEICFHPVYTQTPTLYLMTRSKETRIKFLYFIFGSMDVYFKRFEASESIQTRHENVRLFNRYMEDREGVLADEALTKDLTEHVDALYRKVLEGANDLSLDDKFNMVLYSAKAFLGLERRSVKSGRTEKLREAWKVCEADAEVYLQGEQETGDGSESSL